MKSGQNPDEFDGHSLDARTGLALHLLDLLADRKHGTHYIAFNKSKVKATTCGLSLAFNPSRPYLLGFDYMITYINWYVKEKLGSSARGLMIIDAKRNSYQEKVQEITIDRRFAGPNAHRVKWITEINYAIDSKRNPMIQLSDLVVFCVRRFLEIEHGYRDGWPDAAKTFYAKAYARIHDRLARKTIVERQGRNMDRLNSYISEVQCLPVGQWKRRYWTIDLPVGSPLPREAGN